MIVRKDDNGYSEATIYFEKGFLAKHSLRYSSLRVVAYFFIVYLLPLDTFQPTFRDMSTIPFLVHTTVEGIHEKSLLRVNSPLSLQ